MWEKKIIHRLYVLIWKGNDGAKMISDSPASVLLKHKSTMAAYWCVINFLRRRVDEKRLMRFQSENSLLKFTHTPCLCRIHYYRPAFEMHLARVCAPACKCEKLRLIPADLRLAQATTIHRKKKDGGCTFYHNTLRTKLSPLGIWTGMV